MTEKQWDFTGLKAVVFNCTLKKSPEVSNTEGLVDVSRGIMEKHGVSVEVIRPVDHDIATGIYPDMREKGWKFDEWPELYKKVTAADILIIAGPIWLGDARLPSRLLNAYTATLGSRTRRVSMHTTAKSAVV
jgi:multimeric flavodoxin WrbA